MADFRFVMLFGFLAFILSNVKGLTDSERTKIMTVLLPHIVECSKDHDISDGAIDIVATTGIFSKLNPCFIACVFKRVKAMDSNGLIDEGQLLSFTQKYLSSEHQKKVPEIAKNCAWVNDKEVSDGAKGCDRAKYMVDCFTPHKELFFPV